MRKRIACAVLSLALINGPALANDIALNIGNELSACVAIHIKNTSIYDNMVLADTVFQLRKSIGECGCRSALVSYDSITSVNTAQQVLQNGLIGITRSGSKTLVLASEQTLIADKQMQLRLRCAPAL
ncbi:MAG TPA: DUF2195 family protein [Advenella sp.]|nr:DUF2195 family protein [Advenella sp.]